jgi:hypothetical protein
MFVRTAYGDELSHRSFMRFIASETGESELTKYRVYAQKQRAPLQSWEERARAGITIVCLTNGLKEAKFAVGGG